MPRSRKNTETRKSESFEMVEDAIKACEDNDLTPQNSLTEEHCMAALENHDDGDIEDLLLYDDQSDLIKAHGELKCVIDLVGKDVEKFDIKKTKAAARRAKINISNSIKLCEKIRSLLNDELESIPVKKRVSK